MKTIKQNEIIKNIVIIHMDIITLYVLIKFVMFLCC